MSKALIFCSRAKGVERVNSDVDLVIWGVSDQLVVQEILEKLDSLPQPYKFDLSLSITRI